MGFLEAWGRLGVDFSALCYNLLMLEEIGHTEVYSVFLFGYNSSFDCFIRYFFQDGWDDFQKYEESNNFHKSYNLFLDNFKKAEEVKKEIFDYYENPEKYYSYSTENGQITYKKTSEISSKFDDYITAVYRTHLTFFEFIDRFDVDKNDLHKEYYDDSSKSDSRKRELYEYLSQNTENWQFFDNHFREVVEILNDIKKRRNFGIDHNFSGRKLELKGKLLYALDKDGKVIGINPPTTIFREKEVSIFEYVDFVFNALMKHFQHILIMYSNNILQRKYTINKNKNPELISYFHSTEQLKKLYTEAEIEFPKHLEPYSKYQIYIFGSFMENQFVKLTCSSLIDPKIKYQNHLNITIQEPYFSQIKNGQKTIEGRMSSKKYREIKKGDRILINKRLPALVEEVKIFSSFEKMFDHYGLEKCLPEVKSTEEGLKVYESFYKNEDVIKYGVIAFKFLVQHY